jgi:hypothetical protein
MLQQGADLHSDCRSIVYKQDRNYREAVKCYTMALKLDKDNVQIMRDLALLQVRVEGLAAGAQLQHRSMDIFVHHRQALLAWHAMTALQS